MSRGGTLIFDWPGRHTLHPALPACIILAVLLHAGLFYIFTIIYPAAEPARPRTAQVFFVPGSAPDHSRLTSLLQTDDPAIFAPGRGLSRTGHRTASRYTPVYEMDKAELDLLPAASKAKADPVALAGPVALPVPPKPTEGKPPLLRTQLVSSGPLASRLPALPEPSAFESLPGQSLEPTIFLVSVRPDGTVAHIVLQRPSGNALLDARALQLLAALRFQPVPGENIWDEVAFHWGADVRPPAAQ